MRSLKPYIFYGQTTSLCETCLELVPAKILIEDDDVFYLKALPRAWGAEDADLHRCGLLPALPGLSEARRHPLRLPEPDEFRLPYDSGSVPITSSIAVWR
jgi:hypothetical protein